jgi:hypothetical protein
MSLWLELALVFGGLVALVAVVWVPLLAMDYRRRNSGKSGLGILQIQATFVIAGLALAAIAFVAVVLSPR